MNEFEPIVTSFNISLRLKELGVKQKDSIFIWHHSFVFARKTTIVNDESASVAAFTAQELLNMFPKKFHLDRQDKMWYLGFNLPHQKGKMEMWIPNEENLANVLANKLITLLKSDRDKNNKFKNLRRIK